MSLRVINIKAKIAIENCNLKALSQLSSPHPMLLELQRHKDLDVRCVAQYYLARRSHPRTTAANFVCVFVK